MSDLRPGEKADETVAIWAPVWLRVWLPLVTGVFSLTIAGLTIAQGRAPVALIGAATMALLFWNGRVPILFADATGVRVGHRRCVPWSDVAELGLHPADGWNHPVVLVLRDGTRRRLMLNLDPTDASRLERLLAASRGRAGG